MAKQRSHLLIICLLGALSVISPFAIDMYLPAFSKVAEGFNVETTMVSLTLSSYFIGLAIGQIFYGPLLDRFGRKRPLYAGLAIFVLASAGCAIAPDLYSLVAWRFVQAIGGCVAGVASLAMVHDIFPTKERARILSRLVLFIAISPLLAPSIGGTIMLVVDWQVVFLILGAIVALIMLLIHFYLPESHMPDPGISLRPATILKEYMLIFRYPRFHVYALSGAFAFAGLFTFVAGSPIIFMDNFQLSPQAYSGVFALLAGGFIGGSQLNVALLKRFSSERLFLRGLITQLVIGLSFVAGTALGWFGLEETLALFLLYLMSTGISYPNAAALALAPFSKNAGSASALLGFLQLGVGALISTFISMDDSKATLPIILILSSTSIIGMGILLWGRKRADACPGTEDL